MSPARASSSSWLLLCGPVFCFSLTAESCTTQDHDPYITGKFIACCGGLEKKIGQWEGTPRLFFLCRAAAAGPVAPPAHTAVASAPLAAPPGSSTIRVAEWNVYYQNHNTQLMASVLRTANADIVGLCEFTANPQVIADHLTAVSPGRAYRVQPGRGAWKGYGTDIIFDSKKFEAVEGGVDQVVCPGTAGGPRAAHWAVLRERSTRRFLLTGGIHTSYCGLPCTRTKVCEVDRLYSRFNHLKAKYQEKSKADVPILWMGDLNSGRWSAVLSYIRSSFEDLAQTRSRTHKDGGEIDWIMGEQGKFRRLSGGRTARGLGHQNFGGSDHFPIYAELAWEGSRTVSMYEARLPPLHKWPLESSPWWLLAIFPAAFLVLGAAVAGRRMMRPAAAKHQGDGATLLEADCTE